MFFQYNKISLIFRDYRLISYDDLKENKNNLILFEDEVQKQHESFKLKPLSVQGMSQKITYTNALRIIIFCIETFFSVCFQDRLLELHMFVSMCVCMYVPKNKHHTFVRIHQVIAFHSGWQ